ncbi:MAG: hypothetical protein GYB64_07995 [Chloroflexi bacterium]|nr:hypothetical protein [Chloroflexota bacterium]
MWQRKTLIPAGLAAAAAGTIIVAAVVITAGGVSVNVSGCDPAADSVTFSTTIHAPADGTYTVTLTVTNETTGASGSQSGSVSLSAGANTLGPTTRSLVPFSAGDTVRATITAAGIGSGSDTCGGSGSSAEEEQGTPFVPHVKPVDAGTTALYQSVPLGDVAACGVFDVNGHGFKIASAPDFPACPYPAVAVFCFNDQGQWTDENIFNVVTNPFEVNFTSGQHGICALFPTP